MNEHFKIIEETPTHTVSKMPPVPFTVKTEGIYYLVVKAADMANNFMYVNLNGGYMLGEMYDETEILSNLANGDRIVDVELVIG